MTGLTATGAAHVGSLSGRKYHGCRCLGCYDAAKDYDARRRRHIGYGTWQPLVDAAPAREHVEQLHAQGMTWRQIAKHSGTTVEYLVRLRLPVADFRPYERIRPERAAALLAVTLSPAPTGPHSSVPTIGPTRRLRALRANGWPNLWLAQRCEISRQTLDSITNTRRSTVYMPTAEIIVDLYDDVHDQNPQQHGITALSVERAARRARRLGWAPPRAWDGLDMDDPAATPGTAGRRREAYASTRSGDSRRQAIVEDTAELVSQGYSREAISGRLGVRWDTVVAAHSRCRIPVPAVAS